ARRDRSPTKNGRTASAGTSAGRPSSRMTSCARSTAATARSARGAHVGSGACPKAVTARSTSRSIIPASSTSSRAGPGTSARTPPVPTSPRREVSPVRKAAGFPLVLLVSTAATGWMYLLHPALPGPRLGQALPLDDLARHASVSIAWYIAVWAVAAGVLGVYA